jgi:hypothetical protein
MSGYRASLAALSLAFVTTPAAFADDILISRTDDRFQPSCTKNCSLREAFYRANHAGGSQRIVLAAGTYRLTLSDPGWNYEEDPDPDEDDNQRGDLDVTGTITLVGASQNGTVIQGVSDRLIEVRPGGSLTLGKLTLRDGVADTSGGAVRNDGSLVVQQVSFIHNRADVGWEGNGGAVANFGSLTINHALFQDNNAHGDEGILGLGGALYNQGTMLVRDVTFDGNTVDDSDVDYARGGAIYNLGTADVARTTFIANRAGEYAGGGGGSAVVNTDNGSFKLTNATVSGNLGTEINGVISNGFSAYLPSGTQATMQLINVTVAGNGGLGLSNLGQLTVRNSLVAGNSLNGVPANCANGGNYQARGLLLGSDQGNCTADVPVDDALTFTRFVYPIADNNGETQTHALRKGSPAVDAGVGSCTSTDQRGLSRPRDGDGDGIKVCDLGAYERAKP